MICTTEQEASASMIFYTVRENETLYKISKYYNIGLDDLIEANPEFDPDHLQAGDLLRIPLSLQVVDYPVHYEPYKIQEEDTLYKLSQRFNIKTNGILKANPHINPDGLLPGQTICIPKLWSVYSNPDYGLSFMYPVRWARVNDLNYEGVDGFFRIAPLHSSDSIEEICRQEAIHKLKPYGSRPEITPTVIEGHPAGIILPSSDQRNEMKRQSAILLQLKREAYQTHLMIWCDLDHLHDIKDSLSLE
jgi:LysM repeat protein